MNQVISGITLLGVVLFITVLLFAVAYSKKPKASGRSKAGGLKSKPSAFGGAPSSQLIKLKAQIGKYFPDFTAIVREHHLVLERNAKKVAMLTLDTNAALGRRRLGEVTVINFHKLPSVEELRIELSGV